MIWTVNVSLTEVCDAVQINGLVELDDKRTAFVILIRDVNWA